MIKKFRFPRVTIPILALIWLAVTTVPFIFMVVSSVKSQEETFTTSVWAPPSHLYWGNYAAVLKGPFFTYFRNSLFTVGVSVALIVVFSAMAA
ncbi:carbohydrate ABC transporter permease, partial [Paraburkholderia sp. BR14261]